MKPINYPNLFVILGGIAMLAGAVDPLEGSIAILTGAVLMALGTYLGHKERQLIRFRIKVLILVAFGVAALWGLSFLGGFGGNTGLSMWWGVLILPYPIGWTIGVWGSGSPRWMLWLGIVVGIWYLALALITQMYTAPDATSLVAIIAIAVVGALTIGGCIYRLRKQV